jgi:PTH1 family peptidyl-tRNA hydrolase
MFVGLGNPGSEYATTRHNIGFMVVDAFVAAAEVTWTNASSLYDEARLRYAGIEVVVIKPLTYMNLSGKAVAKRSRELGISPTRVVVITDEYNFPVGKLHLKQGGSSGGHNGIASVIEELETANFWRLRCGIDRKFGPGELVDYVLAPFDASQSDELGRMIERGCEAIRQVAKVGPALAMQKVNTSGPGSGG